MAKLNNINISAKADLEECYKYVYYCSVPNCEQRYGTDKEEKSRHLCPVHDLNFRDNKFKETFAARLNEGEDK